MRCVQHAILKGLSLLNLEADVEIPCRVSWGPALPCLFSRTVCPSPGHPVPGCEGPPAGGHLPAPGPLHRAGRAVPPGLAARGRQRCLHGAAQRLREAPQGEARGGAEVRRLRLRCSGRPRPRRRATPDVLVRDGDMWKCFWGYLMYIRYFTVMFSMWSIF